MRSAAVVGDIHGELQCLEDLLKDDRIADRELVFLGDYINRGRSSKAVVQLLISVAKSHLHPVTFLRGNHDEAFHEVLEGGSIVPLLQIGGASTVQAWVPEATGDTAAALRAAVSNDERAFFANLEPSWAGDEYLAYHDVDDKVLQSLRPDQLLIVGHRVQRDFQPKLVGQVAYIDTGCGTSPAGCLTALLLPEREFASYTKGRPNE